MRRKRKATVRDCELSVIAAARQVDTHANCYSKRYDCRCAKAAIFYLVDALTELDEAKSRVRLVEVRRGRRRNP